MFKNRIKWFDRKFEFERLEGNYLAIIERIRDAPLRLYSRVNNLPPEILIHPVDGGWTIQEHAGHLLDLETLWKDRIRDFAENEGVLTPADVENKKTYEAKHNETTIQDILQKFAVSRIELMLQLEFLAEYAEVLKARHPRLDTPMRLIDMVYFIAEHDDHHLATIQLLIRELQPPQEGA